MRVHAAIQKLRPDGMNWLGQRALSQSRRVRRQNVRRKCGKRFSFDLPVLTNRGKPLRQVRRHSHINGPGPVLQEKPGIGPHEGDHAAHFDRITQIGFVAAHLLGRFDRA